MSRQDAGRVLILIFFMLGVNELIFFFPPFNLACYMSLHLSTKQPWPLTDSIYSYPCPPDGGPEALAYNFDSLPYYMQHAVTFTNM